MRGSTELSLESVESFSRTVVIGEGGYGKTQMLYKLGERARDQAPVFVPLGNVSPPVADDNPTDVFVSWIQFAQSLAEGVPVVTRSVLDEGVCTFLLDGLDQVRSSARGEIVRTIVEVSRAYPLHRFVIASRRIPEVDGFRDAGFELIEIVPRDDWLVRYAEVRGLDSDEIAKLTSSVPAIADLLRIPLFGAAAVDAIVGGQDLPQTALQLVEVVAAKGLDSEELRLRADPEAVSAWLNRIALTLELTGASEITRGRLLGIGLESDLSIGESEEVVDHLITRALLAEAGGTVRFAANVVQEARAARTLLDLPGGTDILRRHVLVGVGDERHIRASWVHTVDLLLTAAPREWRQAIAEVDELAAVRALPPESSVEERSKALEVLWEWYRTTRIWFPRDSAGELLDDIAVVKRLSSTGVDDQLLAKVRAATEDPDDIVRGNAVYFLSAMGDVQGIEDVIPRLIRDGNSVVRRHVAVAAVDLEVSSAVDALKEQMAKETEELAEETIAWSLMKLMDEGEVGDFVLANSGRKTAWRLWSALDERWDRLTQLSFLGRAGKFNQQWFAHLLDDESGWSEEEVTLAARLHFSRQDHVRASLDARNVFNLHSEAALREGLKTAKSPADVRELYFLIGELSDVRLEELANQENDESVAVTLREFLEWRRSPKPAPDRPERPARPSLSALIEEGNSVEILRTHLVGDVEQLTDEQQRLLGEIVNAGWWEWEEGHGSISAAVTETEGGFTAPRAVLNILGYASALHLSLTASRWVDVVKLPFGTHEYTEWLKDTFDPDLVPRLIEVVDELKSPSIERLVLGTPTPWPEGFARAVATRVYGGEVEDWTRSAVVSALEASGLEVVIRELADSKLDDYLRVALVRLGDCDVEAELLSRLRAGEDLMPRFLAERSNHWLEHVRCASSVELLVEIIKQEFGKPKPESHVELLYGALNRSAREDALRIYDELSASGLEAAGFFWYPRAKWARVLSEEKALSSLPGDLEALAAYVLQQVTAS